MLEVSPSFRRHARLRALVRRLLAWPARVAEARRLLTQLGQMTDRELSDIGLLRSDLFDCAALPRDEDPGRKLAQARAARADFAPAKRVRVPEAASPTAGEWAELAPPALARLSDVRQAPRDGCGRPTTGDDGKGTRLVGA